MNFYGSRFIFLGILIMVMPVRAAVQKNPAPMVASQFKTSLTEKFKKVYKKNDELIALRKEIYNEGKKAVPTLIEVMKGTEYPDKNRWMATFLLGQIMGSKSAPFIAKFVEHPHWVLRLASLKTLLALKETSFEHIYAKGLDDKSMLVRSQSLTNIQTLKLKKQAPKVWSMLYDKKNYTHGKLQKRTHLIKTVIKTVGDLEFEKAKEPLLSMADKKKYADIFPEIDYALSKITKKTSPAGSEEAKRHFWRTINRSTKTISMN